MPEWLCVTYDGGWKGNVPYSWLYAAISALHQALCADRLLYNCLNCPIDQLSILVSCS